MVQLSECQENEQNLAASLRKAEEDLTESQKVVQELTKGLEEASRVKGDLARKLEVAVKVKSMCEDKLASAEADLARAQEFLLQRDDRVKTLEAELNALKVAEVKMAEKSASLKMEKTNMQGALTDRDAKIVDLEEEVKQLKGSLAKINKAAFNNAVSQLQVVNPGIDVKPVHYRKCASGGKIGSVKDNASIPSYPRQRVLKSLLSFVVTFYKFFEL
ncbi:uncharacterized protein LOC130724833 [Lotus japonicus]|uniref:uncharacterized protein LOC130724833 n=1 Tax=Lotus japonicus TaxID=34305 RepID=UPI002590EA76|nr:uncharacterized protein LOC130724833 [Lotus japonicus]